VVDFNPAFFSVHLRM